MLASMDLGAFADALLDARALWAQALIALVQVVFWEFAITCLRGRMRRAFEPTAWWARIAHVRDALGRPAHKEVITNLSFAVQHGAGTALMLASVSFEGPAADALFRHGVLCEV
jgi:hypothetical protein